MTKPIATLEIDLNAIDPSRILIALGEPQHHLINNLNTGQATLTIFDRDQVTANAALAAYKQPTPSTEDVRNEASRRMQTLVGARDARHLELIQLKGHEDSIELLDLMSAGATLTAEQQQRAADLRYVRAAFQAIRNASNVLEPSPPADYTDDKYWP